MSLERGGVFQWRSFSIIICRQSGSWFTAAGETLLPGLTTHESPVPDLHTHNPDPTPPPHHSTNTLNPSGDILSKMAPREFPFIATLRLLSFAPVITTSSRPFYLWYRLFLYLFESPAAAAARSLASHCYWNVLRPAFHFIGRQLGGALSAVVRAVVVWV